MNCRQYAVEFGELASYNEMRWFPVYTTIAASAEQARTYFIERGMIPADYFWRII